MGQHKTNPVALAAARGELPPRPPKRSKREVDRMSLAEVERMTGLSQIYDQFSTLCKYMNEYGYRGL